MKRYFLVILLSTFSIFIFSENFSFKWELSQNLINKLLKGSESPHIPVFSYKIVIPLEQELNFYEKKIETSILEGVPKGVIPEKDFFKVGTSGLYLGIPYKELLIYPIIEKEGKVVLLKSFEIEFLGLEARHFLSSDDNSIEYSDLFLNYFDVQRYLKKEQNRYIGAPQFESDNKIYKISIDQDGLVLLTNSYLNSIGIDFSSIDPRKIHIVSQGYEIPIYVYGEEDGVFDSEDYILFYAQKLFIRNRSTWNGGDFTDTNVYFLFADNDYGIRMEQVDVSPIHGDYPIATTFYSSCRFEQNTFMSWAEHLRPNGEVWYWAPGLFYYPGGGEKSRTITLSLPKPVLDGTNFTLSVENAGLNNVSHILDAKINNSSYQRATFSGKGVVTLNYTFPQNSLNSDGTNVLTLRIPSSQSVTDNQIVDYIIVTYLRTTECDNNSLLIEDNGEAKKYVATNFTVKPFMVDISQRDSQTNLCIPKLLINANYSSQTLTFDYPPAPYDRKCFISANFVTPLEIKELKSRNLKDTNLGCKFLILTHPDFHPEGNSTIWNQYINKKMAQFNNSVLWLDIEEIYDNFSYGIFDPTAIKTFLTYAYNNWALFPSYLLLIGDASYDYKNYMNDPTFKNWVPTMIREDLSDYYRQGWYASDAYFADVNGDGYPDLSTGRLPVRSYSELEDVLEKLMKYEDQVISTSFYKILGFIADTYDEDWEMEFEELNESLRIKYAITPYQYFKIFYHDPPYNGTDQDLCASHIRNNFYSSVLVHYAGHSGWKYWGYNDGILSLTAERGSDLDALPTLSFPYYPLPFIVNSSCYNAGFAYQGNQNATLMEKFFTAKDKGIIGATGYTTITYIDEDEYFTNKFYESAFGITKKRTIGELVERGRFAIPSLYERPKFSLVLIGDPTTKILLPDVPNPLNLTYTSGNKSITLDWIHPQSPPYGYNIYRSSDNGITYSKVNSSVILYPNSTFVDSNLINGKVYYYYVVSVNSEGFESAPSNVISAVPLNPNPPAPPTGLKVLDTGTGDTLLVSWNANSEEDLSYYKLYYGTSSRSYTDSIVLSKNITSTTVNGLTANVTYYFAVTATNTSLKESDYSSEVTGIPTNFPVAYDIPKMITDLKLERDGNDIILRWSKPKESIKGNSVTISSFEIYRVVGQYDYNLKTVSTSYPNAKISVDATNGVDEYSYTDVGAVNIGDPVTYLVIAKTDNGFSSPASHNPPAPILSLRVKKSTSSSATLIEFEEVNKTIDNKPTIIIEYRLYAFYPITSSKDHVDPMYPISPLNPVHLYPPLSYCEENAYYCDSSTSPPLFYTVVAVDNRGNTSLY